MIPRTATQALQRLARGFPVVALTGPRQSGKTTLAREVFADKAYVSLENPDEREFAERDPRAFLSRFNSGAILDEVQRCPQLLSWLQGLVDERGRMGDFILTGSAQFDLVSGITQSLAGRVGRVELLPFSGAELAAVGRLPARLEDMLLHPPRLILAAGNPQAEEDRLLHHPALSALKGTRRERLDPLLLWCGGPTIPRTVARLVEVRRAMSGRVRGASTGSARAGIGVVPQPKGPLGLSLSKPRHGAGL